jgi:hypothetical protein
MDDNIKLSNNSELIRPILRLFKTNDKYNFTFTLNQDLLLERYDLVFAKKAQSNIESKGPEAIRSNLESFFEINFPFINYNVANIVKSVADHNGCVQSQEKYCFNDFIVTVKYEMDKMPQIGRHNYLKLHGSSNWQHSEGYAINLTGNSKRSVIESTNILKPALTLFEKVIEHKLKIVVIGYGFKDAHINDLLIDAVDNGSSLAVINPIQLNDFYKSKLNFKRHNKKKACSRLFNSIERYYPLSLKDFSYKDAFAIEKLDNLKAFLENTGCLL